MTATISNIDVGNAQTPDTNDNLLNAHIHAGPAVRPALWRGRHEILWSSFNDNNPNDAVLRLPLVGGVHRQMGRTGSNGTTLAAQLANLRAGRAYINFHTVQFTGGDSSNFPAEDAFRNSLVAGLNGLT
jgi:hypothetical protein